MGQHGNRHLSVRRRAVPAVWREGRDSRFERDGVRRGSGRQSAGGRRIRTVSENRPTVRARPCARRENGDLVFGNPAGRKRIYLYRDRCRINADAARARRKRLRISPLAATCRSKQTERLRVVCGRGCGLVRMRRTIVPAQGRADYGLGARCGASALQVAKHQKGGKRGSLGAGALASGVAPRRKCPL